MWRARAPVQRRQHCPFRFNLIDGMFGLLSADAEVVREIELDAHVIQQHQNRRAARIHARPSVRSLVSHFGLMNYSNMVHKRRPRSRQPGCF